METQTNEKVVKRVLVFEDNPQEAIHAQERLAEAGINDYKVVGTLAEGLDLIPKYDAVLTDLFFPAGNMPVQPLVDRFFPRYEDYCKEDMGIYYSHSGARRKAETRGLSIDDFVEQEIQNAEKELHAKDNSESFIKDSAKRAYERKTDELKIVKLLERVRTGIQLPLGVVVAEKARELGKDFLIVTSTYHHDIAVNPILGLIRRDGNQDYVDGYDERFDDQKNWSIGVLRILPRDSKQQISYFDIIEQGRDKT